MKGRLPVEPSTSLVRQKAQANSNAKVGHCFQLRGFTPVREAISARSSIYADTMHEQSWQKIQMIEAPKELPPPPEPQIFQKPQFTQPLGSIEEVPEGSPALLECRLIPVNDPKLKVEWYFNDKPLTNSNRMALTHDFGHVSLSLSRVYPQDSGVYMCRAVNELGEAVTTASIQVACM